MKRLISLSFLVFAGCATSPQGDQVTDAASTAPGYQNTEAPDPRPLIATNIPSGRCGTLLWTRNGSRVTPVFRGLDAIQATMRIEDQDVALVLQESAGELRVGVRQNQLFMPAAPNPTIHSVETSFTWGQPFQGGNYVSGGSITLNGVDGWVRILPIAGIVGCKV